MELMVVNTELAEQERQEIDLEIDQTIAKYKNNRYEVNRLVFESVAALTASENYSHELNSQSKIKRLWGGFTGKNRELQNKIDSSLVRSQYASQRTLQKLAEQNLMSFELITAVNNKLNASLIEVDEEINKIYGTLVTFFKQTKSEIIQLENRVERLERNVNLLNWQNSIEYQMWNGVEYADLDITSKIVCVVRDFYDITKGNFTTSDLLLLKSALNTIGVNPRELINYGAFIQDIYGNERLSQKLLGDKWGNEQVQPWCIALFSAISKGKRLQEEEKYIVQSMAKYLRDNSIYSSNEQIIVQLISEYAKNELQLPVEANILSYDLLVEVLFNLEQLDYVPSKPQEERLRKAEEAFLKGKHDVAFPIFQELTEENCGRAWYFLGEYYRFGYGNQVDINSEIGYEWHRRGAECGDSLSILNTAYMYDKDSIERKNIQDRIIPQVRELAEQGDAIAQNELADICKGDEKIYWLKESANNGYWRSMYKLACELKGEEKIYWLKKAAEAGYVQAMLDLGYFCYGENKSEDEYFFAIKYFTKAVELGSADAMRYIGLMYDWGYGFKENGKEANIWYKKAAEAGDARAARFYGKNLYNGHNVDENVNEAKKWLTIASDGGDEEASKLLKEWF